MRRFIKLYYKLHKGFVQLCSLLFVLGIYITLTQEGEANYLILVIAIGMQMLHFLVSLYEYISDDDNLFI